MVLYAGITQYSSKYYQSYLITPYIHDIHAICLFVPSAVPSDDFIMNSGYSLFCRGNMENKTTEEHSGSQRTVTYFKMDFVSNGG